MSKLIEITNDDARLLYNMIEELSEDAVKNMFNDNRCIDGNDVNDMLTRLYCQLEDIIFVEQDDNI